MSNLECKNSHGLKNNSLEETKIWKKKKKKPSVCYNNVWIGFVM